MKLTYTFLLLIFFSLKIYPQVSVGPRHVGKQDKFSKGTLESFKKTTTIFVLSEQLSTDEYEKILNEAWTVTPFKVVKKSDFNFLDYLNEKYSIFKIYGFKRTSDKGSVSLFMSIDLRTYNIADIKKKSKKLSEKKFAKKINSIIASNSNKIARIELYPKDDFTRVALGSSMEDIVKAMYTDDVYFNYNLGYLKNYFQKVNNQLLINEGYWLYEDDYELNLKKLQNSTLYIPSYISIKYNGWTGQDSENNDGNIDDLFKKYEFKYQTISDEDLNNKILNNEEVYYLRYCRRNAERFLAVVNSKNGDIVYRAYLMGMLSYKIKPKHIQDLNNSIKKAKLK